MANKQDILTSIRNLDLFLKVPALKGAKARINKNGNPFVFVGGFNMVFQLTHKSKKWAFRVWHVPMGENEERYLRISEYLTSKKLPYFAEFIYDEKGILINGELVDTIRMEWLDGMLLKEYIEKNIANSSLLISLADNFLKMCQDLRDNQISHGDLQEGNILVTEKGDIKLVDYDSICIPNIEGQKELVTGLKGYQHPSRFISGKASLKADYFSELIIYLSILAIAEKPELWDKYQVKDTQYLIFSETDFEDLENSDIFSDLRGLSYKTRVLLAVLKKYLGTSVYTNLKPFHSYSLSPIIKKAAPKKLISAEVIKPIKESAKPVLKNIYLFIGVIVFLLIVVVSIKFSNDDTARTSITEEITTAKTDSIKSIEEARKRERIKQEEKRNFESSFREARQLYDNKQYSEALLKLNESFIAEYADAEYYWFEGVCFYKTGNYESAVLRFTQSNNLDSSNTKYLKWRTVSYFYLDEYNLAILDCSKVIENLSYGDLKAQYYNLRGNCYEKLNNSKRALQDYKDAIYNDPSNETYSENLEKLEKQIQSDIIYSLPTNYLYKTKTLSTGYIESLTKEPYNTNSKITRKNLNNEDVYVIEKTNPYYYKVYIGGKIGYISKNSLVNQQTESKTNTPNKNGKIKTLISEYTITVTSRKAYIYSYPKRRRKYRTKNKISRGTTLITSDTQKYNDDFYKIYYYDDENKKSTYGYIRLVEVEITN